MDYSNDFLRVPHASQQRSFRVPSPPRIFVPPPIVTPMYQDLEFVEVVKRFESSRQASAGFLKAVTYGNFKAKDHVTEWSYEDRRLAQEILPFLYLGPVTVARNREWLAKQGISMVIAVRDQRSAHTKLLSPKAPIEMGLQVINVDVLSSQQLIAAFPRAIESINLHLSERYQQQQIELGNASSEAQLPGKVLVFCETGNDRSATLAAAYIMAMYSVTMVQAVQIIQSQRFCIAADDNLKWTLSAYQDILEAKRQVAGSEDGVMNSSQEFASNTPSAAGSLYVQNEDLKRERKRSVDRLYEETIVMQDMEDEYHNNESRRVGSAPFAG